MFVVGLTGGIASGKTYVSDCFNKLGVDIIDSDVIAKEVVMPETPGLQLLVKHFGSRILEGGALDRSLLREIIFNNEHEKQFVEKALHPIIKEITQERIKAAASPYCIYSSPLLFETGQEQLTDRVLVIDLDPEEQRTRASQRDGQTKSAIDKIINAQMARNIRLKKADDVLVNSGTKAETNQKVGQLHAKYLELAKISSRKI